MTVSLDPKLKKKKKKRLMIRLKNLKCFMRMPRAHNWFWINNSNEIIRRTTFVH